MHEVDDELREIKREIIAARGLIIQTNNLTNALSADIKSIAKRQQTYEQRISWNSATAYVVFVFVVFAAMKFAWDARVDAIKGETEQRVADNDRLRKEAREALKRDEERGRAEAKAAQFYELVRQSKRVEMVTAFDAIRKEPLSRVEQLAFADAVENARSELAIQLYYQGVERNRAEKWQEAATSLEESLRYKGNSTISPNARLALARAYRGLDRAKDAIDLLTPLAEESPPSDKSLAIDSELQDDALRLLALCQMELQAWNDAKITWRQLVRRFPDSVFTPEAKQQLWQLQTK